LGDAASKVNMWQALIRGVRETLGLFKAGVGRGSLAAGGLAPPRPLGSSMVSPRSPRATVAQHQSEERMI
jgi:hypothetical protein